MGSFINLRKNGFIFSLLIYKMDEPIVVVDVGSSSIKAGFSGEDSPSYIYPSTLMKHSRMVEVKLNVVVHILSSFTIRINFCFHFLIF